MIIHANLGHSSGSSSGTMILCEHDNKVPYSKSGSILLAVAAVNLRRMERKDRIPVSLSYSTRGFAIPVYIREARY